MPKLSDQAAKAVSNTEPTGGGDFEPLKPGKYYACLSGVEERTSRAGRPYWSAEFTRLRRVDDDSPAPGRQWLQLNIPTSESAPRGYDGGQEKWAKFQAACKGRLAQFFEAMGFTPDSDTDEMIGEWAILQVSVDTINQGPRTGQATNRVEALSAVPDDFEPGDIGDDTEPPF